MAVVFGGCPFGYGVVGFDLGLILSFDSHHGYDWCLVGFLVVALWVLWVEVVVDFMGFVPGGRMGFLSRWWWWVSCGKCGGDRWLKERVSEENIIKVMGEMRERETRLYYFIR